MNSYTRARVCIISRLKEVIFSSNIGLHSLRAGGATVAANSNVNERCSKRHGRWKKPFNTWYLSRYIHTRLARNQYRQNLVTFRQYFPAILRNAEKNYASNSPIYGRWKSDSAKDGYIADSLEHRLDVTKLLGL
jgi:hypothetical protein